MLKANRIISYDVYLSIGCVIFEQKITHLVLAKHDNYYV